MNENKPVVTTCKIVYGQLPRYPDVPTAKCSKKHVTAEQMENYAQQLKDYLLKIEYVKTHSYDNSDDDRAEDSESRWEGVKYCEIDLPEDSEHIVVQGDTVIGVVFVVKEGYYDTTTHVFLFDESIQESMMLGYSASHSSDWTHVERVTIVKRGQNGAPQQGNSVNFKQAKMYPSI